MLVRALRLTYLRLHVTDTVVAMLLCLVTATAVAVPRPPVIICPAGTGCNEVDPIVVEPPPINNGDAPYDLSDYDIPFNVNWPIAPTTTSVINVTAGSISSLQTAVATNGARVIVPAGIYDGSLTSWGRDVDVVMDNSAFLNGGVSISGAAERIRWTGGNVNGINYSNGFTSSGVNDILIHNVRFRDMSSMAPGFQSITRFAYVRVTANARNYIAFHQGASQFNHSDVTIAGCDFYGGDPSGRESTVRFQRLTRGVVVGSRIRNGGKHVLRAHYASSDIYWAGNVLQNDSNSSLIMTERQGGGQSGDPSQNLGPITIEDNVIYNVGGVNVLRKNIQAAEGRYIVRNNTAYNGTVSSGSVTNSARWSTGPNPGDIISNNIEYPYQAPPVSFAGGADH